MPTEKDYIDAVNRQIKDLGIDTNQISDGYHTFGELYEHRIILFIALCKFILLWDKEYDIWKSQKHSDGTEWKGWFIMGIGQQEGGQITYHLPMSKWADTYFIPVLDKAPAFDGHTSEDVLKRLQSL